MNKITIADLIKNRMQELQLTKHMIVDRMGHTNRNRGLNKLDSIMKGSILQGDQSLRLARAIEVEIEEIYRAMAETQRLIDIEIAERKRMEVELARWNFVPYLCAMCEKRVPSKIWPPAFIGDLRKVSLGKEFAALSYPEQLKTVKITIVAHYERFKDQVPYFGKILHYAVKRDFDDATEDTLLFDIEGNLMTEPAEDLQRIPGIFSGLRLKNGKRIDERHLWWPGKNR